MSYNNDVMMCLVNAIRSLEPLEVNLETLNENISVFERIAEALEEQNELKKITQYLSAGHNRCQSRFWSGTQHASHFDCWCLAIVL